MFCLRNSGWRSVESLKFNLIMEVGGGLVWGGLEGTQMNLLCFGGFYAWAGHNVSFIHYSGVFFAIGRVSKQGIRSWAMIRRGFTVLLFLVTFAKLQKVTVIFVIPVCLPICSSLPLSAWNSLALTRLIVMKIDIWAFFKSLLRKFKFYYNLTSIRGILLVDCCTSLTVSRSVLLRARNVSDKYCTENQNTHFMFNNILWKSCRLWDNVEKYRTAEHAHCIRLQPTLRIYNTYCFSTATMVARTHVHVMLCVHCLSFSFLYTSRDHFKPYTWVTNAK